MYVCELDAASEQPHVLEFELRVFESGLSPDFQRNLTFDHSQCCLNSGINDDCRQICKPQEMDTSVLLFSPTVSIRLKDCFDSSSFDPFLRAERFAGIAST